MPTIRGLLGFTLLILLGGCTVSTLHLTPDKEITLSVEDNAFKIKTEGVQSRFLNLGPLRIHQETLRCEEGNLLVFETTDMDDLYVYNFSTSQSMKLIFDAKKVRTLYALNNLHIFQVMLKNSALINVLVHQSGDQSLSFVYGFSPRQIDAVIAQVKKPHEPLHSNSEETVLLFDDPADSVKTKWDDNLLFFAPLITPAYRYTGD